ncbi:hypothetical protein [Bradyrhizobium sp. 199]|uniref:hypothetical protein n=1 Tax=Bradyrhizobium sp. 199 TaxID=2782664 RepID=UPI001FFB0868|nr:hypothetical protein [Bradyrhizobium sp. 199]MCK1360342.1 hypothetical protein [Bradyrhizobium sp. 199]
MAEDKVVLGQRDTEHHHDDHDKPQRAPIGLSWRALRSPASRPGLKKFDVTWEIASEGAGLFVLILF